MGRYQTPGYQSGPSSQPGSAPPPTQPGTATDRSARREHGPRPIRIALWGAAAGGKTTYLGALWTAANQLPRDRGRWQVFGNDSNDTRYLDEQHRRLVTQREFPPATHVGESHTLHVHGDLGGRLLHREVNIALEVQDLPGDAFQRDNPLADVAVTHIEQAQGVVFLIDPTRDLNEETTEHTVDFIRYPVLELAHRHKGNLPQSVAICLTKFDEEEVFRLAVSSQMVDSGHKGPVVPDGRAEEFIDWFCEQRRNASAAEALQMLRNNFHPDRTRYYVTSSIGFYLDQSGQFDMDDHANTLQKNGKVKIRGNIHPINVLEPIIHLEHKIRTGRW